MKYSAEDIVNQSFEKKLRGFDPKQVHEFMQSIAREWDDMTQELLVLQTKTLEQSFELKQLRQRESGLLDALNTAKDMADGLIEKASERAERIVDDAAKKAEHIVVVAQRQEASLQVKIKSLEEQRERLAGELRGILNAHMHMINAEVEVPMPPQEPPVSTQSTKQEFLTVHRKPRKNNDMHHTDNFPEVVSSDDEMIALVGDGGDGEKAGETLLGLSKHNSRIQ